MVTQRRYKILVDFERVHRFLTDTFDRETLNSYLLPQYFEYAHMHSYFEYFKTHHIGIWEDNGEIVGIACFEMRMGTIHMHTHKSYRYLLPDLLTWSERELSVEKDGKHVLKVMINDTEPFKRDLLKAAGYELVRSQPHMIFTYDKPFPKRRLPEGFKLIDGTDIDFVKIHRCWWEGFDHGDEPDGDYDGRIFGYNSPNADLTLGTIAVAPNGDYACALGMWFDETNKYAYLEPLATVPKYRRLGLATVCLTEAMKKTKALGAEYCFTGNREFYSAFGCEAIMNWETWKKEWSCNINA